MSMLNIYTQRIFGCYLMKYLILNKITWEYKSYKVICKCYPVKRMDSHVNTYFQKKKKTVLKQ